MTRLPHHPAPQRRGFTLIEAIATMVVLGTLGSIVSGVVYRAMRNYSTVASGALAHAQLTSAMERVDRELREIDLNTSGAVAPAITATTASSITFSGGKLLTRSGTSLNFRTANGVTTTLLDNVSVFTVAKFNEANGALASSLNGAACNPIRRIAITLTVTVNGTTDTLRTRIYLRNAMTAGGN